MNNKKTLITFGMFFLLVVLFSFFVSAQYTRAYPSYSSNQFSIISSPGSSFFNPSMCQEGQDFILQIDPTGCEPSVVRSDLLEDEDLPVYCPIVATQLNPLIDVEAINNIIITGETPKEVSGLGYLPAKAALGYVRGAELSSQPVLDNIGYAIIVLKQQPNESAMPDFVDGQLTATIRYDIENAFGVGRSSFYVPVLNDQEWENDIAKYSFWNGRGYVRVESISDNEATVSIYSDREASGTGSSGEKRRVSTSLLKVNERSSSIPLPGFNFCFGNMQVQLNDLEDPTETVRLEVNGNPLELKEGQKFIDERCTVRKIDKKGVNEKVTIDCREDSSSGPFELVVSPRLNISVDGSYAEYSLGDRIFSVDEENSAYLVYVGTKSGSTNEDALFAGIASIPGHDTALSSEELDSLSGFIETLPSSELDSIVDVGIDIYKFYSSIGEGIVRRVFENQNFRVIEFAKEQEVFGLNLSLKGFGGARDVDINNLDDDLRDYHGNAVEDYGIVTESFPSEAHPVVPDTTLGEVALGNEITFLWASDQKKSAEELCDVFEESYPNFIPPSVCQDRRKLVSPSSAVHDVFIQGKVYRISFNDVNEPDFEDFGAKIYVSGNGLDRSFDLRRNQVIYLNRTSGEFIQLIDVDKSSNVDSVTLETNIREGISEATERVLTGEAVRIPLREGFPDSRGGYTFGLQEVNLRQVASVSINPNINYQQTKADFNFRIGIEKRAIQLTPEQTQSQIDFLNQTLLPTLRSGTDALGKVVSAGKFACTVTSGVLTFKNFISNLGGEGTARQQVMRGQGGWFEICTDAVNAGEYGNIDSCLLDNNPEIESSVNERTAIMKSLNEKFDTLQQGITNKNFLGEDVVDTDQLLLKYVNDDYKEELLESFKGVDVNQIDVGERSVSVSELVDSIDHDKITITQARNIQLNSRLLNSDNPTVRDMALAQLGSDLSDYYVNSRSEIEREGLESRYNGIPSVIGSTRDLTEFPITNVELWGNTETQFTGGSSIDDNSFVVVWKDRSDASEYLLVLDDDRIIQQTYKISNKALTLYEKEDNKRNPLGLSPKYYRPGTYENKCTNCEVRYFETSPYQGVPAIVPFDIENGWYAATKSILPLGGSIQPYDDSGRISSFWLGNVGPNGKEEFNQGSASDDIYQQINLNTGQPYNQFNGLSPDEASRKVTQAVEAIVTASRRYEAGLSEINIQGQRIPVGEPAVNIPDIQCQDIMSAKDCNILFNVCDPVICPSSRCDFGGRYPVEDVAQTGIIGGLMLCAPNFPEVKVPICLSAVHAGFDSLTNVLDSYQQCLQTSLETGQTVGVCDEIRSVYLCELAWRQGLPLAEIVGSAVIGEVAGDNVRGGGEYLETETALQKVSDSVDFFTQYYAANSFEAFEARTAEGVGTEFCKNWISYTPPEGGNIIDALVAPDSPPQFYGNFDEIPFTTATNPPTSHYKVFYYIYAGKDFPAYYQVYLRGSGSSFFQDTNLRRIVDQGFIEAGQYVTAGEKNSNDFTAPSGYQEMCIVVNGQEECGFKQVTTDFGINYVTEQYVASQASNTNVDSEAECNSGTVNILSLLDPSSGLNPQNKVEDTVNPAIYNRGLIRICATDDPGFGSDASAGTEDSRWVKVGHCGNENVGCWLDTNTVKNVIKDTKIEDETLQDVTDNYVEVLKNETGYVVDFNALTKAIRSETKFLNKVRLIDANIGGVFFNSEKGYLTLLRADAYAGLALEIYEPIKAELQKGEVDDDSKDTTSVLDPIEVSAESDLPIFIFKDGLTTTNLNYRYSDGIWEFSNNKREWWGLDGISSGEGNGFPVFSDLSDENKEFLRVFLTAETYHEGLTFLTDRVIRNSEGGFLASARRFIGFSNAKLTTESGDVKVEFSSNSRFRVNVDGIIYWFEYVENQRNWRWSIDESHWIDVPETTISGTGLVDFEGKKPIPEIVNLINYIERSKEEIGDDFIYGASIIFNLDSLENIPSVEQVPSGSEELSLTCSSASSCRKVIGDEIVKIASEIKQQEGISDSSVLENTDVESFECLVLLVATTESGIRQCGNDNTNFEVNGNPLYCEGNYNSITKGDVASAGVMQINTAFVNSQGQNIGHCGNYGLSSNVEQCRNQLSDFETNVNVGIKHLLNNYKIYGANEDGTAYRCYRPIGSGAEVRPGDFVTKIYHGWEAALRGYNGWNSRCTNFNETTQKYSTVGNPIYVDAILSDSNRNLVEDLFPEVCSGSSPGQVEEGSVVGN